MKKVLIMLALIASTALSGVKYYSEYDLVEVNIDSAPKKKLNTLIIKVDGEYRVYITSPIKIEYNEQAKAYPVLYENTSNTKDFITVGVQLYSHEDNLYTYEVVEDYKVVNFFKRINSTKMSFTNHLGNNGIITTSSISLAGFTKAIHKL